MFKKILFSNLLLIALLTLLILCCTLVEFYPLQTLEYKAYDIMVGHRPDENSSSVVIVAIDEESIQRIGSWPWPRSYISEMINRLSRYGANTLGICLLYSQEELNLGLQEIKTIRENLKEKALPGEKKTIKRFDKILARAQKRLNHDAGLIFAVKYAKNVVLPFLFSLGQTIDENTPKISKLLLINSIALEEGSDDLKMQLLRFGNPVDIWRSKNVVAKAVTETFDKLARKAGALGHINLIADQDGTVRKVPLLISYQGKYFPSFSLQMATKYLGGSIKDIKIGEDGNGFTGLSIKSLKIPTDGYFRMFLDYNRQQTKAKTYSFSDVIDNKILSDIFRDKIIMIGVTAKGLAPIYKTSSLSEVPLIVILGNALENILSRFHISRPSWIYALEIIVLLYFALFLMFVIPRVNLGVGAFILGVFLITWVGISVFLFMGYGYWIKIFPPILLSIFGYALAVFKQFSVKKLDDRLELNKTLGLSFQSQGMLDMALEKFMKCPIENNAVKNLFYNLGLDFERKRMSNKALAVYEHIMKAGNFKDIAKKIEKLNNIGEIFAISAGSGRQAATTLMENTATKPTLGRYEILRELGRGAMGTVYLGKDPTINRDVAIKTLQYEEIDESELEEVKTRFFREAEAAGKLSHPNIVAIYDAGEEHDMAYIAMELLAGEDLSGYCLKKNLLPVKQVLKIGSSIANALDYAHSHGVVHRDIKPANIMLLEDKQVKVADFGIARVMTSSKTKTGIVFGTPSYMSPEQIAGKKVDGRSDLFSLGVVLYELFTGERPFKGENITALMYAITNASYPPLSELSPNIPSCCAGIVDKLLKKGVTNRFNAASKVVNEIEECLKNLK